MAYPKTVRHSLSILLLVAAAAGHLGAQVHKTPMAGKWFPAGAPELRAALEKAFSASERRGAGAPARDGLLALVAPHAGLEYSGVVGAASYRALGQPANVIILGFSHSRAIDGVVAPDLDAYETPLGRIPVNREVLAELGFRAVPERDVCDHSLENQLPLLQYAAPKASVTPLYVGDLSREAAAAAARKLASRIRQGDVVIASSDFTHYGPAYGYVPFPKDEKLPGRLRTLAMDATDAIGSIKAAEFDAHLRTTGDTICGRDPIRLLVETLDRLDADVYLQRLDYMTSGEILRDYAASVGYGALAFYPAAAFHVSEPGRRKLLESARAALDRHVAGEKGDPSRSPDPGPELMQKSGVFVSIKKDGELRGCIGALSPGRPLWDLVPDRTLAASSSDPRFKPLSRQDGPVKLEISVLTPLKKIPGWKDFRLGRGAVLIAGDSAATFLPQVAEETGWTREQFLENLARKAGLSANAYRDPKARLYVFEAQVFAEQEAVSANGHTQ
ncbi:MAG: AmmeMemoRadiSam system protein B [Bryobacteraceae bacterium]|nr:AmmeMemoRadiSam system protein B [Bryobacteraceae bacterium]